MHVSREKAISWRWMLINKEKQDHPLLYMLPCGVTWAQPLPIASIMPRQATIAILLPCYLDFPITHSGLKPTKPLSPYDELITSIKEKPANPKAKWHIAEVDDNNMYALFEIQGNVAVVQPCSTRKFSLGVAVDLLISWSGDALLINIHGSWTCV